MESLIEAIKSGKFSINHIPFAKIIVFKNFKSLENIDNVQRLIRNQNLNVENRYGVSPLTAAAEKGAFTDYSKKHGQIEK